MLGLPSTSKPLGTLFFSDFKVRVIHCFSPVLALIRCVHWSTTSARGCTRIICSLRGSKVNFHDLQFACSFFFSFFKNVKQAWRVLCTHCMCCAYKHKLWAIANIVALEVVLSLYTCESFTSFVVTSSSKGCVIFTGCAYCLNHNYLRNLFFFSL